MTAVPLRWEELLMPLLQKYKLNITWGDQDLLNIIFHHNPGMAAHSHLNYGRLEFTLHYCVHPQCIFLILQNADSQFSHKILWFILFFVPREPAGVSLQVELSPRSLHLWQQLCVSREEWRLHPAWQPRCLPRPQTACLQGHL